MRSALLSVAVGLAGAALVTGAGWSLQTVTLRSPEPGDAVVTAVAGWLSRQPLAIDVFRIGPKTTSGLCLHGSFPRDGLAQSPSSLLGIGLESGPTLPVWQAHGRIRVRWPSHPGLDGQLAATAGCTDSLLTLLAHSLPGERPRVSRASVGHEAAIAIELPPWRSQRVTIFVTPRTYRPFMSVVRIGRREATARLSLVRVTAARRARLTAGLVRPHRSRR